MKYLKQYLIYFKDKYHTQENNCSLHVTKVKKQNKPNKPKNQGLILNVAGILKSQSAHEMAKASSSTLWTPSPQYSQGTWQGDLATVFSGLFF